MSHITDSKSPAFEVYCKRLLDSVSHKKKLPGLGIRNPLYFTWGDHSLRFLFLLLLLSICSPDSISVCTVQYHKMYLLFVQRSSYVLFLFVLTERPHELFAADPHTYRKWKPIHARKFGYDVGVRPLSVHTDSEGRGKKNSVG